MKDKIQEELEKEIENLKIKLNIEVSEDFWKRWQDGETDLLAHIFDEFTKAIVHSQDIEVSKAKLSQHIATKQAMIKEFEKMIDEKRKVAIHNYTEADSCDECNPIIVKLWEEDIKVLNELKQKLGELKT
jgi:hypothetical protein